MSLSATLGLPPGRAAASGLCGERGASRVLGIEVAPAVWMGPCQPVRPYLRHAARMPLAVVGGRGFGRSLRVPDKVIGRAASFSLATPAA